MGRLLGTYTRSNQAYYGIKWSQAWIHAGTHSVTIDLTRIKPIILFHGYVD